MAHSRLERDDLSLHTPARTRAYRHSLTVKPSDVNVIYIYTAQRFKAMGLLFCILGLVWWFPIGLVILAAFVISRAIGAWHRPQFAGGVPSSGWGSAGSRWESRLPDRPRDRRGCGSASWQQQTSSGSQAFDDYRAETLRRLEDEQRDFKEFLQQLRGAKDRAELDQFLDERRNKPRPDSSSPDP